MSRSSPLRGRASTSRTTITGQRGKRCLANATRPDRSSAASPTEPDLATGSHRLAAAAGNDVLLVLPEGEGAWAAGDVVDCLPAAPGG